MAKAEEYYGYFGRWSIDEYVQERIYGSPVEMARFQATIENLPQGVSTLLDVGCGAGVFLDLAGRSLNIRGIGIELTEGKLQYAREKLQLTVFKGDASCLSFKDRSFDVVTALEVVEHLPYGKYEQALEEIQRVAGRWILISVPYRERRVFLFCPYCQTQFNPNYHMRTFGERNLGSLFERFELRRMVKVGWTRQPPRVLECISRKRFRGPLPEFAICPSCGYRPSGESKGKQIMPESPMLLRFPKRVLHRLVGRNKSNHVIGLYERKVG